MHSNARPTLATLATRAALGDGVFTTSRFRDNLRLFVPPARLIELLSVLKDECGFDLLSELAATDYLGYPGRTRAAVRGPLRALESRDRRAPGRQGGRRRPRPDAPLGRLALAGADWMEREVFDMYGIEFTGHPDLRRILMPEEFAAYPAPQGLSAPRPGRTAQFPAADARRILTQTRDRLADHRRQDDANVDRTCSTNPSSRPSRKQVDLDPQLRAPAPRHPHDAAPGPRARRRADRQGDARHRLSALGLREARRAPQLQPVRHDRRPQELHQPADERGGLAPRGREAARHRADPALPVHPGDHRRAGADQRPPALHRRRRARPGGVHRVPVRVQPPRADLRRLRRDVGIPVPSRLHPGRRRALRLQRPRHRPDPDGARQLPQGLLRHGEAAVPQPDLPRPAPGRRRVDQGRRDRPIRAPGRSPGPAA